MTSDPMTSDPVTQDTLSDVLRFVRLRGAVFYYLNYGHDWAAEAPASARSTPGSARRRGHRDVSARGRARDVERSRHAPEAIRYRVGIRHA